jgi:hypothetical protein
MELLFMKIRSFLVLRWTLAGFHQPRKGSFVVRIAAGFANLSKSRARVGGVYGADPNHALPRMPLPTEEELRDLF